MLMNQDPGVGGRQHGPPGAATRVGAPTRRRLGGPLPAGSRAVEIGCGAGYGTRLILENSGAGQVDAVDLDPTMIGKAERRLRRDSVRVRLAVGDATDPQASLVRARRRTTPRACATRRE